MNDEEKKTLLLERVRDFEIRKRTDSSLKNSAITLGGYERGLGFNIGEIEALCEEMEEDEWIRLSPKLMGSEPVRRRTVQTTSFGRQKFALVDEDEINRVKNLHASERANDKPTNFGLSPHGKSVILTSAALLDSIAEYREHLRGDNYLASEHKDHYDQVLSFLDWLYPAIQELILSIPYETEGKSLLNEESVKSWRHQYWPKAKEEFAKYTSPDSVAKATIPAAIVLTSSSLGLLLGTGTVLGAAAGASAGAFIGNTLVGHAKPKELTDKIEEAFEPDESSNE